MKAAALVLAMLVLTAQLPVYEYLITISAGNVIVHCDTLLYVGGKKKELIAAQCLAILPTGNVYEISPYARFPGTPFRVVDALLSIDPEKDSGTAEVVLGGKEIRVQWSLLSKSGVKVLTPEGVAVLGATAALVGLGAAYTIRRREKYMID